MVHPPRPPPVPKKRSSGSLATAASNGAAGALVDSRDDGHKLDAIHETSVTRQNDADTSQPTVGVAAPNVKGMQISDSTKELREQPAEKTRDCGPADEITWDAFDKRRGDEPPDLTLIPTDEILGDCQGMSESVSLDKSSTNVRGSTSNSREVRDKRDDYHL